MIETIKKNHSLNIHQKQGYPKAIKKKKINFKLTVVSYMELKLTRGCSVVCIKSQTQQCQNKDLG